METEIIKFYCMCDDMLKDLRIQDDVQVKMTTAEVITTAFVSVKFFGGNFEKARLFLKEHNYMKTMLSRSQFNRRLHRVDSIVWENLAYKIERVSINENDSKEFVIDSFPIGVCDNYRIKRCKIYDEEKYRGYIASKKRYFFGLRVHCVTTVSGGLVEFLLAPGSFSDIKMASQLRLDLPQDSTIYADKAYNDYEFEDLLKDVSINWMPIRKKNSKRPFGRCIEFIQGKMRKTIETTFSLIRQMLPSKIHAVTAKGFELKVCLFILGFGFKFL